MKTTPFIPRKAMILFTRVIPIMMAIAIALFPMSVSAQCGAGCNPVNCACSTRQRYDGLCLCPSCPVCQSMCSR